ncbi:MAG: ATP-binding cassette domain-containing protein [Bacillota bacterium]|nr:ATP-binding cassette domain-containing protein [Bacillota bacterium]
MIHINIDEAYYYPDTPVLKDFKLDIEKGEIITVIGPSGCGKSTLLKIIAGLHNGVKGRVDVGIGARIGFIPQNKCLLPWKTVYENIVLLTSADRRPVDKNAALELIKQLGLERYSEVYPLNLSGGQYQRVLLGQVFFFNPDIILMDEPFSALDTDTKNEIIELFLKMQKDKNITTVLVTHNHDEARAINGRVINLADRGAV